MTRAPGQRRLFGAPSFETRTRGRLYSSYGRSADGMLRWAVFDLYGASRYELGRVWGPITGVVAAFVGLNPSRAGAEEDDQTVAKLVGFGRRLGFDGFVLLNLTPQIATDPANINVSILGESCAGLNARFLLRRLGPSAPLAGDVLPAAFDPPLPLAPIVACWGRLDGPLRGLADSVQREITQEWGRRLRCLGTTADGSPRHPSRLGYQATLEPFPPVDREAPTRSHRKLDA